MVEAERRKRSGSVTKVQQDTGIPRTAPRYKLGLSSESSSDRKRVLDIGERRNLRSANVRSGEPSFTKSTAASPAEMTSRKSKETSKIGFRTQLSSKAQYLGKGVPVLGSDSDLSSLSSEDEQVPQSIAAIMPTKTSSLLSHNCKKGQDHRVVLEKTRISPLAARGRTPPTTPASRNSAYHDEDDEEEVHNMIFWHSPETLSRASDKPGSSSTPSLSSKINATPSKPAFLSESIPSKPQSLRSTANPYTRVSQQSAPLLQSSSFLDRPGRERKSGASHPSNKLVLDCILLPRLSRDERRLYHDLSSMDGVEELDPSFHGITPARTQCLSSSCLSSFSTTSSVDSATNPKSKKRSRSPSVTPYADGDFDVSVGRSPARRKRDAPLEGTYYLSSPLILPAVATSTVRGPSSNKSADVTVSGRRLAGSSSSKQSATPATRESPVTITNVEEMLSSDANEENGGSDSDAEEDVTCHICASRNKYAKMKCTAVKDGKQCPLYSCHRCIHKNFPDFKFDPDSTSFTCPVCLRTCPCSKCCIKRGVPPMLDRKIRLDRNVNLLLSKPEIKRRKRIAKMIAMGLDPAPGPTKPKKFKYKASKATESDWNVQNAVDRVFSQVGPEAKRWIREEKAISEGDGRLRPPRIFVGAWRDEWGQHEDIRSMDGIHVDPHDPYWRLGEMGRGEGAYSRRHYVGLPPPDLRRNRVHKAAKAQSSICFRTDLDSEPKHPMMKRKRQPEIAIDDEIEVRYGTFSTSTHTSTSPSALPQTPDDFGISPFRMVPEDNKLQFLTSGEEPVIASGGLDESSFDLDWETPAYDDNVLKTYNFSTLSGHPLPSDYPDFITPFHRSYTECSAMSPTFSAQNELTSSSETQAEVVVPISDHPNLDPALDFEHRAVFTSNACVDASLGSGPTIFGMPSSTGLSEEELAWTLDLALSECIVESSSASTQ